MGNKEFFNRIAYKWDSICNHNPIKVNEIIELAEVKKNSKILDVGTGTGVLLSYLLDKSPTKITAIDISENMIEIAESKYNNENINFVVDNVMNFNGELFDYIFIYSAYPHFKDKKALFNHMSTLLNKDGKIIIAHSEGKDKINGVHAKSKEVKDHALPPAHITVDILNNYLKVDTVIDNEEMYFISAVKQY